MQTNATYSLNPGLLDLGDPNSDSYLGWTVIERTRLEGSPFDARRLNVAAGYLNSELITNLVYGKSVYAEERYLKEAKRLWGVLDRRLAQVEYVAGDYSIADIAIWPWIARFGWQTIDFADYPQVKRWYLTIAARPAVQRGFDVPSKGRQIPMP